jgi:hypothetical protein
MSLAGVRSTLAEVYARKACRGLRDEKLRLNGRGDVHGYRQRERQSDMMFRHAAIMRQS